jgi:hypothetical protein
MVGGGLPFATTTSQSCLPTCPPAVARYVQPRYLVTSEPSGTSVTVLFRSWSSPCKSRLKAYAVRALGKRVSKSKTPTQVGEISMRAIGLPLS